jgi:hypothetical protein
MEYSDENKKMSIFLKIFISFSFWTWPLSVGWADQKVDKTEMKLPAASCGVSKRNCADSQPAFALKSFGAVRHAIHPCSKLQGILAKAN